MRVLALSDHVVDQIYHPGVRERFAHVDLVLSCGDLPYSYLEYVVTMLSKPAFFVHGNHDRPEYTASGRTLARPGGWTNLDGRVVKVGDLILTGFEGSLRYKPHAPFQYSEVEMRRKVMTVAPALLWNRVRYGRYVDVVVSHAPPRGVHDGDDLPHRGFDAFRWLVRTFKPRYLLHGHKHVYRPEPTRTRVDDTIVVNVYLFTELTLDLPGRETRQAVTP